MKIFLKLCPNCETKKKGNERYCSNCGYDFKDNHMYNIEDDIRETNKELRYYLKKQKRKDMKKSLLFFVGFCSFVFYFLYSFVHKDK